jgi:hypothetical protein
VEPLPGQSALGWAYSPELATPETDGIVIRFNEVGGSTNTLVHELGHYLGLYHVWGLDSNWPDACYNCDSQGPLTSGDKVPDTNPCCAPLFDSDCEIPPDFYCSGDCACSLPATPYPVENYMSYVYSCQNSFTAGQADRMHFFLEEHQSRRGLWQEDNLLCAGAESVLLDFRNTSTVEWTTSNLPNGGEIFVAGDLVIPAGKTLIIRPGVEVQFCHGGSLVIQPNARLQLHGTLTGKGQCPGSTWQGVKVYGSAPGQPQLPVGGSWAQGRIACYPGSMIENAEVGIQLYGPDPAHAGGLASCNGATIRNCRIGVKFAPYQNLWPSSGQPRPYAASFTGVNFLTDEGYPHEGGFHSFVHMTGVNGISLTGCSFTNTRNTTSDDIAAWGYGIFANDAGFSVRSLCMDDIPTPWPGPCEEYVHSKFSGLGYGVYTARIGAGRPYTVRQANFEKCFVGIRNKGVTGGTILFNNFNLGELPSSAATNMQSGICFEEGVAGFTCQENKFEKTGAAPGLTAIGIFSENTGDFSNVIRKNRFIGLDRGNLAKGSNGAEPNVPPFAVRGLNYLCNENLNVEMQAGADFDLATGWVRSKQGLPDPDAPTGHRAAGNYFSYTGVDFINSGTGDIEYFYNPFGANEEPLTYSGNFTATEADPNDCPTEYCEPPCKEHHEIALIKAGYFADKESYLAAQAGYAVHPTEEKRLEIAYHRHVMDEAAYMVVIHQLYDTLDYHQDTLLAWISNMDSPAAELWIAGIHLASGNVARALQVLGSIPGKYNLSAKEHSELQGYIEIAGQLAGQPVYSLDEQTLALIRGFEHSEGHAGGWARNILTLHGAHFPPAYQLSEGAGGQPENLRAGGQPAPEYTSGYLVVQPNPASSRVEFRLLRPLEYGDALLLVRDMSGRAVRRFEAPPGEMSIIWDTGGNPSGIYFYQLSAEGRTLQSGKIVLSK